jgi:hypothetical protein
VRVSTAFNRILSPRWGVGGVSQLYKRWGGRRHPGQVTASSLPLWAGLLGSL